MQKAYSRINWKDEPSLDTPLGANNLNKMDSALDVIDNRVLSLSGYEGRVQASEKNAKASEVNAKTSENNAKESEELAREYAERAFNTTPEGYEQIVDTVQKMDIKESADTTLLDSKAGGYKLLSMSGNSVQKTMSGKNLVDVNATTTTVNGVTFTVNDDGSIVAKGTQTSGYVNFDVARVNVKAGESYTFSGVNGGSDSTYRIYIMTTNSAFGGSGFSLTNGEITKTATVDDTVTIRLQAITSGNTVNATFYPMIRKASITDSTFEPYVGGIPSPNPDYPQSINNVVDCVEMIQGYYNDGQLSTSGIKNAVCNKHLIPCNGGDVLRYESENTLRFVLQFYDSNGLCFAPSNSVPTGTNGEYAIPSGASYFTFYINKYVDGTRVDVNPETVGKILLTINGKYVVQIPYANKNLWEWGDVSGINAMGKNYKSLQIGTYTLSYVTSATSGNMNVQIYDAKESLIVNKGTQLANFNNRNSITFTLTTQAESIRFYSDTQTTLSSIQLERGEAMTDYEEHKEKVATILLDAPLREVDVMSRTEVVRNRASVVFDGSETWYMGNGYFYIKVENGVQSRNVLSTHYKNDGSLSTTNDGNIWTNNASQLIVVDSRFTSVADFKAWLVENNVTVEYELATPIVETLDSTSQIALNSLETFDSVTYINVDSRTQPKGITGEYGTSKVGARTIKNELKNDTLEIKYNELVSTLLANNEVAEVEEVLEGDEE